MKLSNSYFFTLRENASEEDSISGNLLVRSGMVRKTSSGVYAYLPLGLKVLKNIEKIIKEEMNAIDSQELFMPALLTEETYVESGRREAFGNDMLSLNDRFGRKYVLGPTHEEIFTAVAKLKVRSYKDLPFSLYQVQNKYRDEKRPRYGLIRVREFLMKDAYSFDKDLDGLDKTYTNMFEAYKKIFNRMSLNYRIVTADTGAMGGLLSEEFQAITNIGEDIVVLCQNCDYASNIEVAKVNNDNLILDNEIHESKELVYTPNVKTIEEVSKFLGQSEEKFVKTLLYKVDNRMIACLVRGDHEVNENKIKKLLKADDIELLDEKSVEEILKSKIGFIGPIELNCEILIDKTVEKMVNFIVGANQKDYHYKNVNISDFRYHICEDIRNVIEKDICPKCGKNLQFKKGIEVGNTFKLGTKYSEIFNLLYSDSENKLNPVVMGCYGIGLGRCMAAVVEQNHDEKGIIWPINLAPYKVCIVIANIKSEEQMYLAEKIYKELTEKDIQVIMDDRDERLGVKLNDMDLIGIPTRILIGKKATENIVELKYRDKSDIEEVKYEELLSKI